MKKLSGHMSRTELKRKIPGQHRKHSLIDRLVFIINRQVSGFALDLPVKNVENSSQHA